MRCKRRGQKNKRECGNVFRGVIAAEATDQGGEAAVHAKNSAGGGGVRGILAGKFEGSGGVQNLPSITAAMFM